MTAQFILIDHSLTGVGGHHHQYAMQILEAAYEVGWQTHLACGVAAETLPLPRGCKSCQALFPHPSYGKWSRLYDGRRQLRELDEPRVGRRFHPLTLARQLKLGWRRKLRSRQFADACQRLFETLKVGSGDQIFLPTMSEFDLLALAGFLEEAPIGLRQATWHLQFHVGYWDGRRCDAERQHGRLQFLTECFQAAATLQDRFDLRFYATTEVLAEQYNQLSVVRFQCLPYPAPVSETVSGGVAVERPLRVLTAGKPRDEKGTQHLPALAEELSDLLAEERVQLVVQTPNDPHWVGRLNRTAARQGAADSPVEIVPFPLAPEPYEQQLRQADIGLFLYDSDEYFARASGVLAELLARGKPVITPAGCWLSEQGSEAEEAYLNHWRREHGMLAPDAEHHVSVAADGTAAFLGCDWRPEWQGVLWRCETEQRQSPVRIEVQQQTEDGHWQEAVAFVTRSATVETTAYTPIAETTRALRIRLFPAFGGEPPQQIRLSRFHTPQSIEPPRLGSHNLAAADWRSAARLLREIVDNYDHYQRSAESFAVDWRERHHPQRTIEILTGRQAEPLQSLPSASSQPRSSRAA